MVEEVTLEADVSPLHFERLSVNNFFPNHVSSSLEVVLRELMVISLEICWIEKLCGCF